MILANGVIKNQKVGKHLAFLHNMATVFVYILFFIHSPGEILWLSSSHKKNWFL